MSDKDKKPEAEEATEKPSSGGGLIMGIITAVILGAVAAGVTFIIPTKTPDTTELANCEAKEEPPAYHEAPVKSYEDVVFVNLDPLVVSLGPNARKDHLKISITLESSYDYVEDLNYLQPKFRDVLTTYLRAVDETDLIEPAAMTRLRSQMLRRLQLVAGGDALHNVLITEFILN